MLGEGLSQMLFGMALRYQVIKCIFEWELVNFYLRSFHSFQDSVFA